MIELEDIEQEIELLSIALIDSNTKLVKLQENYAALVNKPEYPDGTLGFIYDNDSPVRYLVRLINITSQRFPYTGEDYLSKNVYGNFSNFTPLTTAILSMPVENTGTCPWKDGDEVRVEFESGAFETDHNPHGWVWDRSRGSQIVKSWLIKAAK